MAFIITQGFGSPESIAVQGYLESYVIVKKSYGQGAPIVTTVPATRFTFYAETDIEDLALLTPPTANRTQT